MRELALHLLDIAENSVAAQAKNITLTVVENIHTDRLRMTVEDDGKGMDDQTIKEILDGVPLTEPDVLATIRKLLQDGVSEIKMELNRVQSY